MIRADIDHRRSIVFEEKHLEGAGKLRRYAKEAKCLVARQQKELDHISRRLAPWAARDFLDPMVQSILGARCRISVETIC
jgi:hypothetical protein